VISEKKPDLQAIRELERREDGRACRAENACDALFTSSEIILVNASRRNQYYTLS
jgi:hypothetical protein